MRRLLLVLLIGSPCFAAREDVVEIVKEGNFALPTSQQPASLFAFGQNVLDAQDLLVDTYAFSRLARHINFTDIFAAVLYGVSDKFSLYFNIPFTPQYKLNRCKSSGLEDIFVQAEYVFYNRVSERNATQATVVGALFFPTGSTKKNPPIGSGSPSFLLGGTMSYTSVEWYCYFSPFAFLTTKKSKTKFGNTFFYQGGFGRNFVGNPDGWIVMGMVELYGAYSQSDNIRGKIDHNSGGNIVYLGPSFWASSQNFSGQAGVLFAVTQQPKGCQNKQRYLFGVDLTWKIKGVKNR